MHGANDGPPRALAIKSKNICKVRRREPWVEKTAALLSKKLREKNRGDELRGTRTRWRSTYDLGAAAAASADGVSEGVMKTEAIATVPLLLVAINSFRVVDGRAVATVAGAVVVNAGETGGVRL
jgi:hypothetical protein